MRAFYLTLFVVSGSFVSCNSPRYIYSPSHPDQPIFTGKGESKLAAYYSANYGGTGFDLQAAFAPGRFWALTASHFYRKEKDVYERETRYNFFDSSVVSYQRNLTELGTGYFIPFDDRKRSFISMYAGWGAGKFSFTDNGKEKSGNLYSRKHSGNVMKWYLQPAIYFLPGDYFRLSLAGKFSFLKYGSVSTNYTDEEKDYFDLDLLPKKSFDFFEPSLQMEIGIPDCEWLKIDGGLTFVSNNTRGSSNLEARGFNASIGLSFDLSKLKKHH